MTITEKEWVNYIRKLAKLNQTVADKVKAYIEAEGLENIPELIQYSYNLVQKYGEGAAALSAQMYDVVAELEGKYLPAAEMAEIANYGDVAKQVYGTLKTSENAETIAGAVSRLVKQAGADTTLKNAIRDGAQVAWIPHGDTCSFCLMLASNGWRKASKKTLKGGHAEHIHPHCDCQYAIRFDSSTRYDGYNPEEYLEMYQSAEGRTWEEKVNSMRRENYAETREAINAQKRSAYEKRKELSSSAAEEKNVT